MDVEREAAVGRAMRVERTRGSAIEASSGSAALAVASSGKYIRVQMCRSSPRAKTQTAMCGA
jgi:acetolactate synthase regulatory subunit